MNHFLPISAVKMLKNMKTPFRFTQLCGVVTCTMLSLSSCAEFQPGSQKSNNRTQGKARGISAGVEGGLGAVLGIVGAVVKNNGNSDLGNAMMGVGGLLALHAAARYAADARQREAAESKARGRTGTYYVKVPPKKGYSGPSGTHLVPYKNGAVAGDVKVVQSNPKAGQAISINGTQGTVL